MPDALIAAVDLAFNYSLEMVAWAAGLVAFSTGFLAEKVRGNSRQKLALRISLGSFVASIIFGAICLSALIGVLSGSDVAAAKSLGDLVSGWIQLFAIIQFVLFLGSTLIIFALGISLMNL